MKRMVLAALCLLGMALVLQGCAPKRTFAGDWAGVVKIKNPFNGQDMQIHLTIHVTQADDGTYSATLDSTEQKAAGIKLQSFTVKDDDVTAELNSGAVSASFKGKSNPDATKITGSWSQAGMNIPLELTKTPGSEKK